MPKHAIANGLYMGRATPELGFADDITPQEWRIMSQVIGRFAVSRVWFGGGAETNRNGIRGHNVSCEAPTLTLEISDYVTSSVPQPNFGVGHVHISGSTTSVQRAKAIHPVLVRRDTVRSYSKYLYKYLESSCTDKEMIF